MQSKAFGFACRSFFSNLVGHCCCTPVTVGLEVAVVLVMVPVPALWLWVWILWLQPKGRQKKAISEPPTPCTACAHKPLELYQLTHIK